MAKTFEQFNWYIDQYSLSLNNDLDRQKIFDFFLSKPEFKFNKTAQQYRDLYPHKSDDQIIESLSSELGDKVLTIHKYLAEIELLSAPKETSSITDESLEALATDYAKKVWGHSYDSSVQDGTDMTNGEITIKDFIAGFKSFALQPKDDKEKQILNELYIKVEKLNELNEINNQIIDKKNELIIVLNERISIHKNMIVDLLEKTDNLLEKIEKCKEGNKILSHSNNLLLEENKRIKGE